MDLQTIATLARLHVRKVRYVLDQRVLPGIRGRLQKQLAGRPRSFTDKEGFFIACAALLLEGGVRRKTVIEVMERLANMPWKAVASKRQQLTLRQRAVADPETGIDALYHWACEPTSLSIGDGVNLRIKSGEVDTAWVEPRTLVPLDRNYQPRVLIQLDMNRLWRYFNSKK